MDPLPLFIGGVAVGWVVQLAVDSIFYRRSPEYEKALAEADRRIGTLEIELAGARAAGSEEGLAVRDARIYSLESDLRDGERVRAELTDRIGELERRLREADASSNPSPDDAGLRTALREAELRQLALESRLMDVETEIAQIRFGRRDAAVAS